MDKLRVIIFDVEKGFCAFIRSPRNYTLLIDCGATETFSPVKYVLENELVGATKYNGHQLTKFILSHPHDDHLSDISRLMTHFAPGIISRQQYNWDAIKVTSKGDYKNLEAYCAWQEKYNTEVTMPPDWGMELIHKCYLTPKQAADIDKNKFVNNSSIAVFVQFQRWKIAFPGDLEEAGWKALLRNEQFRNCLQGTSFFVTSHHGHSSGYCADIYNCMGKPYFNIVSTRKRDESIEPAYSRSENVIGVTYDDEPRYMFSTRKDGSIVIEVDANGKATFRCLRLPQNITTPGYYPYHY